MKKKLFFSILATIFLLGCGDTTDTPVVKEVENDLEIVDPNATFYTTTNSLQFKAYVHYNDGTKAEVTQACSWSSDYDKVAILYGEIYAVKNGDGNSSIEVPVSAQYKTVAGDSSIRMIALKDINIIDTNDTNHTGYSDINYTFNATATYDDNNTLPIDENNSRNVRWVVDGNTTSVVVENGSLKVTFGTGESNITVYAFDINDTFDINITDANTSNSD